MENKVFDSVKSLPFKDGYYVQHSSLKDISSLEGYEMTDRILSFKNISNFIHLFRVWIGFGFVRNNFKNGATIVDIGSGFCEIPDLLACNFGKYNYYCLEFDSKKLEKVAKRKIGSFNRVLVQTDLSKASLPFADDAVDCAISIESIEHIPKDNGLKLLLEINRILKVGGKLLLTTPNVRNSEMVEAFHIYEYEFNEMRAFLATAGFEILECFGLNISKNIRNIDKQRKDDACYNSLRKILPSSVIKPFFSFDKPDESKAFGIICRKKSIPLLTDVGKAFFGFSDGKNGKQQLRNPQFKKYSEKFLDVNK